MTTYEHPGEPHSGAFFACSDMRPRPYALTRERAAHHLLRGALQCLHDNSAPTHRPLRRPIATAVHERWRAAVASMLWLRTSHRSVVASGLRAARSRGARQWRTVRV